ncbi:hypothetical protein J2S13_003144 [Oikeobacillus pervagus]|uniref:Uncharacterized protein n=1 Tax=Oikeobacillus pervagus TaxID=1325931 RepID=A0AAJ1T108_9BACI|nr:hypothetical protein [Oikeobacillus pervagus]MDQ0216670.1 hypothetical protein [Oikeobacillus pervagus]
MGVLKKNKRKYWILFIIVFFISVGGSIYYVYFYTPKNSLELYQAISFADDFEDAQKLTLEGYEDNFKKEDFDYIKRLDTTASSVRQFTLFEYDEKTYVVMTSPGTPRLKVLAVEELPKDIRNFFIELLE